MAMVVSVENNKLRPCKVKIQLYGNYTNALFHRWTNDDEAIVELEDGQIHMVHPENVIFLDHPFVEYIWDDKGGAEKDA